MSNPQINQNAPPVFLIGIMMRSGTNYLADVLRVIDPELCMPRVLDEDFLLVHSDLLVDYTKRMHQKWTRLPWIEDAAGLQNTLLREIGDGLLRVLREDVEPEKRLLAKTPSAINVDNFFSLFPHARLLILTRDGRDAVASAVASFDYAPFDWWAREWARGANSILELTSGPAKSARGATWEIVRYEDLVRGPPLDVLRSVAKVLDIPCSRVEWRRIPEIPVRGSSQALDANGQLDWSSNRTVKDFSPIGRWSDWTWRQRRQFNRIAGSQLAALGY
jgi:Sulfotransferase family